MVPRPRDSRNRTSVLRPEPVPLGPQRSLRPVGDPDRAEDARQVRLHGLLADRELARDQLVRKAARHHPQYLALTFRELVERRSRDTVLKQSAPGARIERRLAPRSRADRPRELVGL